MGPEDPADELVEARQRKQRAVAFARQREMLAWPKRQLFQHLLALGPVELSFDPRPCIARVPARWRSQTHLAVTITADGIDACDDHGVEGVAALGRRTARVVIPWTLVYSMIGEDVGGIVWQGDVPPELKDQIAPATDEPYIIHAIGGPDDDEPAEDDPGEGA